MADMESVLNAVGPRLRALRTRRDLTLTQVAETTGISVSTLSRLEAGGRKPTLELLLPLAGVYRVPLDELVDAPATGDPRVHLKPVKRGHATMIPLTNRPDGLLAYKMVLPPAGGADDAPLPVELNVHEGYDWVYVLAGRLRLVLGDHDLVLNPGEVAEFDCRTPHAMAGAGNQPVELLGIFGKQGERMHVRARPTRA